MHSEQKRQFANALMAGGEIGSKYETVSAASGDVSAELDKLAEAIVALDDRLQLLETRLHPIISPVGSKKENASDPEPVRSPMGSALHAHARRVMDMRIRVMELLDSIQI